PPAPARALQRHDAAQALEALEPVRPYDRAPSGEFWPSYLRGQAYLQQKNGQAAATQFQSILDRRGEVPGSVLYPLAHLGLARAAVLTGDTAQARKAYEDILSRWNEGDADLQLLKDLRLEHSRLHLSRKSIVVISFLGCRTTRF